MPTVQRFEELRVWQQARGLVKSVYEMTAHFPKQETFGLASQMQRAAVSVMSNIAEGFERGSNTEFVQFLFVARASCGELRSHCYVALDLNYVPKKTIEEVTACCETLSRRLKVFAEYLKQSDIKGLKFRDERACYEIQEPDPQDG